MKLLLEVCRSKITVLEAILGINRAYAELGITVPVVCRLEGTNVDSAKAILAASGNPVQSADSMEDAAKKAVATIQ